MARKVVNVTIANGGTVSTVGHVDRGRIVGIQMPAVYTAGNLTLKGGDGAGTKALVDKGHTALGTLTTPAAGEFVVWLAGDQLEGLGDVTLTAQNAQGQATTFGIVVLFDD